MVEDCGPQPLKGSKVPCGYTRSPSERRARTPRSGGGAGGLTPFVGREDELRSLMNRWERALEGEGQVALIIGEAGIGKSRLLQRFHEQIAGTPYTGSRRRPGAFSRTRPSTRLPKCCAISGVTRRRSAEEQLAQLETRLELAGLKPTKALPLIAPLLNLPFRRNIRRQRCRPSSNGAACSRPWSSGCWARPERSRS